MAETTNKIRFVHGLDATYKAAPTTYANDVYFATDTLRIYAQGKEYKGTDTQKPLYNLTLKSTGGTLNQTYDPDSAAKTIDITAASIGAATTGALSSLTSRVSTNEQAIGDLVDSEALIQENLDTLFSKVNSLAGAFVLKGSAPSEAFTAALTNHTAGWAFAVTTAGTYAGQVCNVGDLIVCQTTGTAANNADWFVLESNTQNATQSAPGFMSAADKKKLDGIATGAEVNQNAFAKVAVGSTTIAADQESDTLTLAAGTNVTLTPDATNDKVTFATPNVNLYVGASDDNADGAATNGNLHLNLIQGTLRSHINIKGTGATTVTSDENGIISIHSTDTNTNTDTKNTAGSTNSSKKLFLVGAETQSENPVTYSHDTAYVSAEGYLYSGSQKTVTVTDVTNSAPTLAWGTTSTVATVGGKALTVKMPANPNTDTHHVAHLYVGATETAANEETTNGNTYLKLFENSVLRDEYNIKGSGSVSVSSENGNITITGTDTKYTLPTATSGTLGGVKLGYTNTGKNYKLQVDTNGNAYVNVPWTDTNTTYIAATGSNLGLVKIGSNITVSGGTISVTSSNIAGALGWIPAKATDLTALQTKVTANTTNIADHETRIDNVESQLCWYAAD